MITTTIEQAVSRKQFEDNLRKAINIAVKTHVAVCPACLEPIDEGHSHICF